MQPERPRNLLCYGDWTWDLAGNDALAPIEQDSGWSDPSPSGIAGEE